MKKLFIGIFAASMMFGFTSCKKDYTCKCTGGVLGSVDYPIEDAKKADAEDACTALEAGGAHSSCELD